MIKNFIPKLVILTSIGFVLSVTGLLTQNIQTMQLANSEVLIALLYCAATVFAVLGFKSYFNLLKFNDLNIEREKLKKLFELQEQNTVKADQENLTNLNINNTDTDNQNQINL